jgi:hypothetical protein
MVVWCLIVLVIGLAVGRSIGTGSRAALIIAAIAISGAIALTLFATNVNLFYSAAFATIPMAGVAIPGVNLPLNELMLAVALSVALIQNRGQRNPVPAFAKIAAAVLLGMMTISAGLNGGFDLDVLKRLGHLVLFCVAYLAIAAGMIPRRVMQRGLLIGISLASASGVIALIAGDTSQGYSGRLTGQMLGDPNRAAVLILVLGASSIEIVPAGWRRNITVVLLAVPFVLTQSRGALLALAVCIVWWLLGRRLRLVAGIAALGGTTAALSLLPSTIQTFSLFRTRSGSDVLRGTILEQSLEMARANFWLGGGPGATRVDVYNRFSFFFHNSFLAVISEGGIVSAAAVVTLIVLTFGRMIMLPAGLRNPWFEMSLLAILVSALHLGEVLLDLPSAVAIGFCLSWLARPEPDSPRPIPPMNRAMGQTDRLNTPNVTGVL